MNKFLSISELSKMLKLVDTKNGKPQNHILRYWEKEFKQINPKMINNRRYYSNDQIQIVKFVKFLLKDKGMTINGVKNVLKIKINKLDDYNLDSLKAEYYRDQIKKKTKKILDKIKRIKYHGKKNSY
tara:strand:+ start:1563 stop:1943 length:381 start_codon:yes stop_codon:yes gene_type:complete